MGGGFGEGGEAHLAEEEQEPFFFVHLEHSDGRYIERAGQRVTGRHGAAVGEVGVLGAEALEAGGDIGYECVGKEHARGEQPRIEKRFHDAARAAGRRDHINIAAVPAGGVREGAVTHPGNDVAGGHLNHHGGGVVDTIPLQGRNMPVDQF